MSATRVTQCDLTSPNMTLHSKLSIPSYLKFFILKTKMAEKDVVQKLRDNLQCTICLDTYTDTKVLQCDHVYCRECIRKLLLRNMSGDHSLTCPSYRQVTPVPENGVQGLKPAFQINSFLEIKKSLEKKVVNAPEVPQGQLQDSEKSRGDICDQQAAVEAKYYRSTPGNS